MDTRKIENLFTEFKCSLSELQTEIITEIEQKKQDFQLEHKTYSAQEVAEILKIAPGTVRKLAREGKIKGTQVCKDRWVFWHADLMDFKEKTVFSQ